MAIDIHLIDFQRALDEVGNQLNKLRSDRFATVGIHESAEAVKGTQMTMAQLGALQNFGSEEDNIPARPWLIPGTESGVKEYLETVVEGIQKNTPPDIIIEQLGNIAVGYVQQFIVDLKDPPNAPYTIQKKGSDNPLIDTGAMRQSVTYVVEPQKPQEGL